MIGKITFGSGAAVEISADNGLTWEPLGSMEAHFFEVLIVDEGVCDTRKLTAADFSHLEQRVAKVPKPAPRHGPRNRWGGLK